MALRRSAQRSYTSPRHIRIRALHAQTNEQSGQSDASEPTDANLYALLPASYRTEEDDLAPPKLDNVCYLQKELSIERLNRLSRWLWVAGRPMPPRPLHHQLLLGREIVIAEQMDLHLVWTRGRIFLKPIPGYLLEPCFWTTCLACRHDYPCSSTTEKPCLNQSLSKCALGFLFSYAALICYESDFILAQNRHLLPTQVRWRDWRTLVDELDTEHIYGKINERYFYGELRLSRLNKIQYLRFGPALRGYLPTWTRYSDFFLDNFTWLTSVTVYIAIVLTAFQVGLATKSLAENHTFQQASYGFAVFSIVGPLAGGGLIISAFLCAFVSNWAATEMYRRKRLIHIREGPETA
ncbi:hypothetical protein GGR52DRAFT_590672 [Hypoxylon sp. FL1284]|nr:hypothetical protein GGR52DRAFT_590672 [Hypoxylon sp. FL1284]